MSDSDRSDKNNSGDEANDTQGASNSGDQGNGVIDETRHVSTSTMVDSGQKDSHECSGERSVDTWENAQRRKVWSECSGKAKGPAEYNQAVSSGRERRKKPVHFLMVKKSKNARKV